VQVQVQVQVGNAQVKLVDKKLIYKLVRTEKHTHTHKRFMALFPGSPGWAGARTEFLDFMAQGKIIRRLTHRPSGWALLHQD